jgi:hypothetical protein
MEGFSYFNPSNSTASPFGWHTDGVAGAEYTTRGNNVWAKDDFMGTNDDTGLSPDGGSSLFLIFHMVGQINASTYI